MRLTPAKKDEKVPTKEKLIIGEAQYKGRLYFVLYQGESRKEPGLLLTKLCAQNGDFSFWAKQNEVVTVTKIHDPPRSIEDLLEEADVSQEVRLPAPNPKTLKLGATTPAIHVEHIEANEDALDGDTPF